MDLHAALVPIGHVYHLIGRLCPIGAEKDKEAYHEHAMKPVGASMQELTKGNWTVVPTRAWKALDDLLTTPGLIWGWRAAPISHMMEEARPHGTCLIPLKSAAWKDIVKKYGDVMPTINMCEIPPEEVRHVTETCQQGRGNGGLSGRHRQDGRHRGV